MVIENGSSIYTLKNGEAKADGNLYNFENVDITGTGDGNLVVDGSALTKGNMNYTLNTTQDGATITLGAGSVDTIILGEKLGDPSGNRAEVNGFVTSEDKLDLSELGVATIAPAFDATKAPTAASMAANTVYVGGNSAIADLDDAFGIITGTSAGNLGIKTNSVAENTIFVLNTVASGADVANVYKVVDSGVENTFEAGDLQLIGVIHTTANPITVDDVVVG